MIYKLFVARLWRLVFWFVSNQTFISFFKHAKIMNSHWYRLGNYVWTLKLTPGRGRGGIKGMWMRVWFLKEYLKHVFYTFKMLLQRNNKTCQTHVNFLSKEKKWHHYLFFTSCIRISAPPLHIKFKLMWPEHGIVIKSIRALNTLMLSWSRFGDLKSSLT